MRDLWSILNIFRRKRRYGPFQGGFPVGSFGSRRLMMDEVLVFHSYFNIVFNTNYIHCCIIILLIILYAYYNNLINSDITIIK